VPFGLKREIESLPEPMRKINMNAILYAGKGKVTAKNSTVVSDPFY